MFIRHFTDSTPQANGQSDLRRLFAYDPARSEHLLRFTQEVMRGPGPLSPGERELLAAMTSTENHCLFSIGSHAAVAARFLGRETVDRVLERRDLTRREEALWSLVGSSCDKDVRRRQQTAIAATTVLTPDEVYLATMVIALFQFYNAFVDMNGVEPLSPEGYEASGVRLSTQGYTPPPR